MSVAVTRWRQDSLSDPGNQNQRLRWYPTYPSNGGGYSTFGWSPVPVGDAFRSFESPAGHLPGGGLSGIGAPLVPGWSGIAKVIGAIAGVAGGLWLANQNLGG